MSAERWRGGVSLFSHRLSSTGRKPCPTHSTECSVVLWRPTDKDNSCSASRALEKHRFLVAGGAVLRTHPLFVILQRQIQRVIHDAQDKGIAFGQLGVLRGLFLFNRTGEKSSRWLEDQSLTLTLSPAGVARRRRTKERTRTEDLDTYLVLLNDVLGLR